MTQEAEIPSHQEIANDILSLCLNVSNKTNACANFQYDGNVGLVNVQIFPDGNINNDPVYLKAYVRDKHRNRPDFGYCDPEDIKMNLLKYAIL